MSDVETYRFLYFSGTGNTEWVLRKLSEKLVERGQSCEMLACDKLLADCGLGPGVDADRAEVRRTLVEFVSGGSVLVLGYPVYESAIPRPLRQLLPDLPNGDGRKLAVVCTYMLAGGDCCHLPESILQDRGYESILATYVKMPNNLKIPVFPYFGVKNGADLESFYTSAERAIEEIADELVGGEVHVEGRGIADYLIGAGQRLGEEYLENFVHDNIFALAKCTRCRECANTCPMGNISFERNYPHFGKNCCDCLRCYNFCPEHAIQITSDTMNEEKYPRYKGFDGWQAPRLRKVKKKRKPSATE